MAREPEYRIEQLARDSFEITEDGRPLYYDARDIEEAEEQVRQAGGTRYVFIGEDESIEERDLD